MNIWTTPKASIEQFAANEYVAACWEVACTRNGWYKGDYHNSAYCGNKSNQVVSSAGDTVVVKEKHNNKILDCTMYTNNNYDKELNASEIKPGDEVWWTTVYYEGGLIPNTYYHTGVVGAVDANRPNHS